MSTLLVFSIFFALVYSRFLPPQLLGGCLEYRYCIHEQILQILTTSFQITLRQTASTMEDASASEPYLTATLSAPQTELDLSGTIPFSLRITATLHAPSPILCYVADTFLYPQTALRASGIGFTKLGDHPQAIQRSSVHINTGNSTTRPWDPAHFLLLQPLEPVSINIPFGYLKRGTAVFDVRLWITTSGFETGGAHEVTLPDTMISWWRLARPDEGRSGDVINIVSSSTDQENRDDGGVSVLPKEQQLQIHTSGEKVNFTCIGRRVGPPQRI
jgi:hypothetical protein